jgi:Domain of unknown function (DUF4281)
MLFAFELSNLAVLPFWALMILAPKARLTARAVASPWILLPPLAVYAWAVLPALSQVLPIVARPELDSVANLLGQPLGALAGWAHFLAFDLFVGRFIVLDARERELPWFVLSPILLATLLLGPLGLLAYLVVRADVFAGVKRTWQRSWSSSKQLGVLTLLSLLTAAACVVLSQVDARELGGASVWLKPFKFGVSIAIASFTVALACDHVARARAFAHRGDLRVVDRARAADHHRAGGARRAESLQQRHLVGSCAVLRDGRSDHDRHDRDGALGCVRVAHAVQQCRSGQRCAFGHRADGAR